MSTAEPKEMKKTSFSLGNQAMREGAYETAIKYFNAAKQEAPHLANLIEFNISLASKHAARIQPHVSPPQQSKPDTIKAPAPSGYSYQLKVEKLSQETISGWAVNTNLPGDIFELAIEINGTEFIKFKNDQQRGDLLRHKKSEGRGGFSLNLPKGLLETGQNKIIIKMPNGEHIEAGTIENNKTHIINDQPFTYTEKPASIIVPIYNAIDDVKVCLERLRSFTKPNIRVFLINDASPDPGIKKLLTEANKDGRFIVIHNENNLGFTKTVNKGITLTGNDDVVLLNSDARVTPRWLEGMQRALSTDSRIATVTAMSDRAGAFSAPNIGNDNDLPLGVTEIEYARAFRRRAKGLYPSVPTGNGFCMYIRRACIDEIGALDEEAFPRGYGEENDFCMRARAHGWRHVIDDRTYVFHDRSKSFAGEKDHLIQAGRKVVDERYPDYKKAISIFSKSPLLALARFSAKQAVADCLKPEGVKPRALFVVATKTGGTPQTNRDLMLALYDSLEPWLLHCDSKTLSLYRVHKNKEDELIRQHELNEPVEPLAHISFEYDRVVANWLGHYDYDIVHIRHLAWHSLSLPRMAKLSGAVVIKSFHDYYAVCPTIKLLDGENFFCGGNCTNSQAKENCTNPLWPDHDLPDLKNGWIFEWRKKFQDALTYVDKFITTSEHARKTILEKFPKINSADFKVIRHGRDFNCFSTPNQTPPKKDKIKILIPGNIDEAKGSNFILELIKEDKEKILEFHILGNTRQFLKDLDNSQIICHGTYKREEFQEHVRKISPHIGAVFSIWDETWCHTLTEIWASGLPAVVLSYPTISERVETAKAGWVMDSKSPSIAYKKIISKVIEEYPEKIAHVKKWQETEGSFRNTLWMAAQYQAVYNSTTRSNPPNNSKTTDTFTTDCIIAVTSPSHTSQTRAPGSTHIRVWEKTRNDFGKKIVFCRMPPDNLVAGVELGEIKQAIIQRNALLKEHIAKIKPYIANGKFSYCFDLDDDLLNVPPEIDTNNIYHNYTETLKELITHAKLVTVSTDTLFAKISKYNKNTTILKNRISERLWKGSAEKTKENNAFTAIYFGTKSHKKDLELILPALEHIAEKHPSFKLFIIGILDKNHKTPKWIKNIQVPNSETNYPEFVQWLKENFKNANLGLAPLIENEFNAFKSNLKALEYAALGLPVLASKGSVYNEIATIAPAIEVVENNKLAWINALENQIKSPEIHLKKGQQNKKWVFNEFSLKKTTDGFENFFDVL
ncbi:glycosyltransferase [Azotobacter salinestris]|uniref:glycosyltransferase n=1 Tax=Azotobacter salinestris TaxID=69964 RepID=UPI0032DF7E27